MVHISDFCGYAAYTVSSENVSLTVMSLGATVLSLRVNGRELALHYADAGSYLRGSSYIGAIVGRYANRITDARFTLNGREYRLTPNENGNQLHGGPKAFDRCIWTVEKVGESAVRFCCSSPDGENGYPGNLTAYVTYRVEKDKLRIEFEGESDADTVFAPTTHLYFNLSGSNASILDTVLQIPADYYLPVDEALLPVGAPQPVDEYFDFRKKRKIAGDYDHCFLLKEKGGVACVAEADGLRLTLRTDYPALQLYTGQGLADPLHPYQGFAIEPEYYPDSPNHPDYPSAVLKRGEHFRKTAEYTFKRL